jgi:3-hydroxyacyl-[acyl-carrier-protein] dehydratase
MNEISEIEKLIPHRSPFLFLDEIISVDMEKIKGSMTFDIDGKFLAGTRQEQDFVPGMIIVESMVQCGGAGVKLLGLTEGLFGLANIEKANFHREVNFGEKLNYEIKNIRIGKKAVKQSGIATINHINVLDATWVCVRID